MREYTFAEMKKALVVGWGQKGERTAELWLEYNRRHFRGSLCPLPIFLTPSMPYGRCLGWTCCAREVTHIALASPGRGVSLVADRGVLLHEMIHQHLHERGSVFGHNGQPWRDEIMRLHFELTGTNIWAGAPAIVKEKGEDGIRRSRRINRPHPETGAASLTQGEVATWPHSAGVILGKL